MADNVLLIGRILQHYNLLTQSQFETAVREFEAVPGGGAGRTLGDFLSDRGYLSPEQARWLVQALQHYEAQLRRSQQERSAGGAAPAGGGAEAGASPGPSPGPGAGHAERAEAAPASVAVSAPAPSEDTLQSAISTINAGNAGTSAVSSWGNSEGTQISTMGNVVSVGGVSAGGALAALGAGVAGGSTLSVVQLGQSGASVPAVELGAGSSWSNLPMVEIEASSALSDRPATEEGSQMWGSLPLAVALATRPFTTSDGGDEGGNQNPWGAISLLNNGSAARPQVEEPEPRQPAEPPLSFLPTSPPVSQPAAAAAPAEVSAPAGAAPAAVAERIPGESAPHRAHAPRPAPATASHEAERPAAPAPVAELAAAAPFSESRPPALQRGAAEPASVISGPAPESLRTFDRMAEFNPQGEVTIHRSLEALGGPTEPAHPAAVLEPRGPTTVVGRPPAAPERLPDRASERAAPERLPDREPRPEGRDGRGDDRADRGDRADRVEGRPSPSPGAPRAPQPSPGRVAIGVLRPTGGGQRRRQRDGRFAPAGEPERDAREAREAREPRRPLRSEETPAPPEVERLVAEAVRVSASDLHLHVGAAPLLRIDGELRVVPGARPVSAELTEQLLAHALSPPERRLLREGQDLSFAFELPGIGRLRAAVLQQQRGCDLILRPLPARLPPLEDLGLPAAVLQLATLRSGLILCTGPAGSGKSTTLAALVEHLGQKRPLRVLSIEDPIELRLSPGGAGSRGLLLHRGRRDHAVRPRRPRAARAAAASCCSARWACTAPASRARCSSPSTATSTCCWWARCRTRSRCA